METNVKSTTVSKIKFQIGEKVIKSKIVRKMEARETFEDAIARGNAAFMAEEIEETPDILKMTVGGIKPDQEVIVTITVLQVLEVECGAYQLRIPQCFFVKYDSSASA
jgi:hypothetical protein